MKHTRFDAQLANGKRRTKGASRDERVICARSPPMNEWHSCRGIETAVAPLLLVADMGSGSSGMSAHQLQAAHLQSVQWMRLCVGSQKSWHMAAPTSSFHRDEQKVMPEGSGGGDATVWGRELRVPPHATHALQRQVVHCSAPGLSPHVGCSHDSNGKSPATRDEHAAPRGATVCCGEGAGASPGGHGGGGVPSHSLQPWQRQ